MGIEAKSNRYGPAQLSHTPNILRADEQGTLRAPDGCPIFSFALIVPCILVRNRPDDIRNLLDLAGPTRAVLRVRRRHRQDASRLHLRQNCPLTALRAEVNRISK